MLVCYFVDLDLGAEKREQQNNGALILKYGVEAPAAG